MIGTCHSHLSQTLLSCDMPRSEIPVDVLRDILGYVDQAGLAAMCRVNKICYSYSQDLLYRDISVRTPRVEQTLIQSTHLARKVRSFSSRLTGPDIAMAFRNMTSLRILKLSTIPLSLDIFEGCTFKLDSFECTYLGNFGKSLPKFLSSQPSLKYVILPINVGSRVLSLEVTCLPNLTRIHTTFFWLPDLIPGRPLNEVIATGYGYTLNEHPIDLSFFALSTTPIQKLTIDYSYLSPTPVHLLASFLPSLTHFTLRVRKDDAFLIYEGVCGLPLY
jgi:hypothetical protein